MKAVTFFSLLLSSLITLSQLDPGDTAPDFTVTDTDGNSHTLSDYLEAGQYVLLDFYFYECVPCQYYAPQIGEAFHKYGCNTKDVVFLGIDFNDSNEEVELFEANYGGAYHYPSASGLEGGGNAVVSSYGVSSYPTILLINPSGEVVENIETPTLAVFDYYFEEYGIVAGSCAANVSEVNEDLTISVFPNPATDYLTITLNQAVKGVFNLYKINGELVLQQNIENKSQMYFDLSTFSKGKYIVEIESDNSTLVKTVSIQ